MIFTENETPPRLPGGRESNNYLHVSLNYQFVQYKKYLVGNPFLPLDSTLGMVVNMEEYKLGSCCAAHKADCSETSRKKFLIPGTGLDYLTAWIRIKIGF